MFIVVACLLAISYALNIWFIYYVCCKQRRRKKRHLTAVQQRAITRRKGSQDGLDNVAIDSEGCVDLSAATVRERKKQESPKLQRNGFHPTHSEIVSTEDGPRGVAVYQQEQQQHVYQRLDSCLLDPSSREYLEILESVPERPTNQQPEMYTSENLPTVTGYQSISPQASENKQVSGKGNENRYEQLLLRNMSSEKAQASSAEQNREECGNATVEQLPDYVEIIGDDNILTGSTMGATPMSPAVTAKIKNPYETLKPAPSPSHRVQGNDSRSTLAKDQQSFRAENEAHEEDYLELLSENEAVGKESKSTADHEDTYEPMNH